MKKPKPKKKTKKTRKPKPQKRAPNWDPSNPVSIKEGKRWLVPLDQDG